MNQPNYLNWPQYDDEVANKAYVDYKLQNIDVSDIRQELNIVSSEVNTLSTTKLDNSVFNNFISTQYNPLVSNVDAKIESFYQNTDPSTTWSTLLEKSTHKGDIWYDTASQRTYVYYEDTSTSPTSYYWQWQNVPTSLINTVDGKANIFVGNTTPSNPNEGDLWFKSITEGIYTYVNNSWQEYNKYTDDTTANTAIGQIEDLSDDLDDVKTDLHTNYVTTQTFDDTTGTLSTRVGVIEEDYVTTTTLNQTADSFNISVREAKNDIDTLNTTLNTYFTFDNTGLTISIGSSSIKLVLDNDSIEFQDSSGNLLASWNATNNTARSSELFLGNFAFIPRTDSNGNFTSLSFRKKEQ